MTQKNQQHDKFFRQCMQHDGLARDVIKSMLPGKVTHLLDLPSLKEVSGQMVSSSGQDVRTDYAGKLALKSGEGEVIVLIEHQSYPDRVMPLRMQRYAIELMYQHRHFLFQGKKIPAVLPIVFYTGDREYPFSTEITDLVLQFDEDLQLYCQNRFILRTPSLSEAKGAELRDSVSLFYDAFSLARKLRVETLVPAMKKLDGLRQEGQNELAKIVEKYVIEEIELKHGSALLKKLRQVWDKERRENMPTLADIFRQWGEEDGYKKGKQDGALEGRRAGKREGKREGHDLAVERIIANMVRQGLDAEIIEKCVQC